MLADAGYQGAEKREELTYSKVILPTRNWDRAKHNGKRGNGSGHNSRGSYRGGIRGKIGSKDSER